MMLETITILLILPTWYINSVDELCNKMLQNHSLLNFKKKQKEFRF